MDTIKIIERHLKEAAEKQGVAYKKVMSDSATATDWNKYNESLAVYIAVRALYLDALENEIKKAREIL